jgi:hypothetical protein
MPNVLMISPGYPMEMPFFARGLVAAGARVLGLGDSTEAGLPAMAREALSAYLRVGNLWDEQAVVEQVRAWPAARALDRVECLWEPGMILAARLREALGLPGMTVEETVPFRDKETMKQRLDAAGIRTPRHRRAKTASEVRAAAEEIGYPLIVKPIAGAGSADTHRVDGKEELETVLQATAHVAEVSVEEFVEAEEFTFDTICARGQVLYHNISWYRPRPLVARQNEWVSSQTIALRDPASPYLESGAAMGPKVLAALGFREGFTHMEWFRRPDGEAVFGEIACRPPGARSTEIMNYACDVDVWRAWAEAVVTGRISQRIERKFNAAIVFKRAQGQGRIRRIDGLERLVADFGRWVVSVDLLPIGAQRRNWKQTLISDGWMVVRHPDLQETLRMCDRIGTELQLYAG